MSFKQTRVSYGKKSAIAEEELLNLDKAIKEKTFQFLQRKRNKNLEWNGGKDEDEEYLDSNDDNNKPYADFQSFKTISYDTNHLNTNVNANLNNSKDDIHSSMGKEFPWQTERTCSHNGIMRLHYEIYDFYCFMKPTKKEQEDITLTFTSIKTLIITAYPHWKVKLFGSNATHLNLPDSDLDIAILPSTEPQCNEEEKALANIKNLLFESHKFNHLQIINARVPIIKGQFKETNIDVDISFGRKNGYAANKIINNIFKDYPFMPPIICLLKYYLRQHKLNSTYTGGISSFCLFTLVYAFVLNMKKNKLRNNETTLGDILIQFLTFYGFSFNYNDVGISIRYGGFFYKKDELFLNQRNDDGLLSIENFQDIHQDIGKNCFKFDKVIQIFQLARDALYYPRKDVNNNYNHVQSYIGQIITSDKLILHRSLVVVSSNPPKQIQNANCIEDEKKKLSIRAKVNSYL